LNEQIRDGQRLAKNTSQPNQGRYQNLKEQRSKKEKGSQRGEGVLVDGETDGGGRGKHLKPVMRKLGRHFYQSRYYHSGEGRW